MYTFRQVFAKNYLFLKENLLFLMYNFKFKSLKTCISKSLQVFQKFPGKDPPSQPVCLVTPPDRPQHYIQSSPLSQVLQF